MRRVDRIAHARRLLVLLLAAAAGSGCGSNATRETSARTGVIPWLNRPLRPYVIPEAKLIRYPASAPPCRAHQLQVTRGRTAVGLGNRLEELVFTNTGAKACLLRGSPTITAESRAGGRRPVRPQRGGTYFGRLFPADLPPGGRVFLDFATGAGCEGGHRRAGRYPPIVFTLPTGGSVRADRVWISEQCGLSMSEFGLPRRYAQPRAAPGTAGTLQARLRLPGTVRAGAVLRYTVTLGNPTGTTVVLRPCPGYTQGLYAAGLAVRGSFALNCRSVHAIPAHARVRYAMRLTVPRGARPGIAKLAWSLDTATGPSAAQVVGIAAAHR